MVNGLNSDLQKVPKGYKQTEVGVIPEDWECKLLGEFGDVVRGGSPRPAGDSKYFNGNYIPWLTVASLTNIPSGQIYVNSTATMLTRLGSFQSRILERGTLIISNSGATLGVAKILGIKCCANDGVAAIINQRVGDKIFLVQYINTKTKELHDEIATGNGQPNLNTNLIRHIPIPYPPIEEQTAIANALSDVDALITSLEKLIDKKRAIKTAAMQQLLTGKKRLSPFDTLNNKDGTPRYKQTELGEIPEDWEVSPLGDICTFENGDRSSNYPSPGSFVDSGIPFINAGHVSKGKISMKDMNYITNKAFDKLGGGKIKIGDILFCLRGSLGKYGIVEKDLGCGAIASSMVIVRPKTNRVSRIFLKCYFDSSLCEKMIELWAGGAAQPNLGAQEMAKFSVIIPKDPQEQKLIARTFSDMDEEIDALEQCLNKTQQIKQGMMQELLTGRTRLL